MAKYFHLQGSEKHGYVNTHNCKICRFHLLYIKFLTYLFHKYFSIYSTLEFKYMYVCIYKHIYKYNYSFLWYI